MTRNAGRYRGTRRLCARIGAALLLSGPAAAGTAGAACTDGTQTSYRPGSVFTCYHLCTLEGSGLEVIQRLVFGGRKEALSSFGSCREACAANPSCTAFVWHDYWKNDHRAQPCAAIVVGTERSDRP